ncbi:Mus7/MMS22 family-domain-containing protein [Limtongia smithiae]|uniref:Mus7/MMS22 family-domain-containing protein n=1 Tax=Limtongia smithiae TaxID=1125753 RepID=UPI0034D00CFC
MRPTSVHRRAHPGVISDSEDSGRLSSSDDFDFDYGANDEYLVLPSSQPPPPPTPPAREPSSESIDELADSQFVIRLPITEAQLLSSPPLRPITPPSLPRPAITTSHGSVSTTSVERATSTTANRIFSSSSPLSSPPSSSLSDGDPLVNLKEMLEAAKALKDARAAPAPAPEPVAQPPPPQQQSRPPQTRILRERTERQRNPYLVDRKMYELMFRRRGIQPIKLSTELRISKGESNTGIDEDDDSQFDPTHSGDSQEDASVEVLVATSSLSSSPRQRAASTCKTARSTQMHKTQARKPVRTTVQRQLNSRTACSSSTRTPLRDIYEFPTSPKRTASPMSVPRTTYSSHDLHKHHRALSAEKSLLPPPRVLATAEATQRRLRTITGSPLSSDISSRSASSNSSNEGSSSDSEKEEDSFDAELDRLKKRVRGVLPPSFLTLEATRQQRAPPKPAAPTQATQSIHKGVAIRKIRPAATTLHDDPWANFIGDSSDSDNDMFKGDSLESQPRVQREECVSEPDVDTDDMEAEEHVDGMFARRERREGQPRQRRPRREPGESRAPRQSRTTQTVQGRRPTQISGTKRKRRPKSASSHKHKQQQPPRKRQRKLPEIGIIDAYIASNQPGATTSCASPPLFVRVAARSAAEQPSFGRTSPSRKIFEFDDEEDEDTVADVLNRWREGTHEAFETARMQFQRSQATLLSEPSTVVHVLNRVEQEQSRRRNSRLPPGVIAIIPPEKGLIQVPPPAPQVASRNRFLGYTEVENGEYAVRRRARRTLPLLERIATAVAQRQRQESVKEPTPAATRPRKRRKETVLPPRQHLHPMKRPTFNVLDPVVETIDITGSDSQEHRSAPAPKATGIIQEFLFPVLNFSITFDVSPLRPGTRFKSPTFIGHDGLYNALHISRAEEDITMIQIKDFHFAERHETLIWTRASSGLLHELEVTYAGILDWALAEQHSAEQVSSDAKEQVYEFCQFVAAYIRTNLVHETLANITNFIAVVKRLNVRVLELFTQFHGRMSKISVLSFCVLAFQLVYFYELYAMLQGSPTMEYVRASLVQEMSTAGRLLVQALLQHGIDDVYHFLRSCRNRLDLQIGRESSYFIELWLITMHTFDTAASDDAAEVKPFWEQLHEILDASSIITRFNVDVCEKIWYATCMMCPLYQFDKHGVATHMSAASAPSWGVIEMIMDKLLSNTSSTSREFLSYTRACFARCLTLCLVWKWPGTKTLATCMYTYFAKRKLENLAHEIATGFPDFLQSPHYTLELSASDTVFHIFLKFLANLIQITAQDFTQSKMLPGLLGLVTPLNGRVYPRTKALMVTDLEALENTYSLLLTQFWAAPKSLRPPVQQLRDVIILQEAHAEARILSVKAWYHLTRLQLLSTSPTSVEAVAPTGYDYNISECEAWYYDLLQYSLDDYATLEHVDARLSHAENARRDINLRAHEALIRESVKYGQMLVREERLFGSAQRGTAERISAHVERIAERIR